MGDLMTDSDPLTCEEAEPLLAAYSVGALDASTVPRLREHIGGCANCRATGSQFETTVSLLPLGAEPVDPPDHLRGRVLARVQTARRRGWLAGAMGRMASRIRR